MQSMITMALDAIIVFSSVLPDPQLSNLSVIYDTWYEGTVAGNPFTVTAGDLHMTKAQMVGYEAQIVKILTDAGVKDVERKETH